jgi:cyclic pyranopterin phosphate synthase
VIQTRTMTDLPILDNHNRPARSLRISVTDRCNLRCGYCMPEEEYVWLPKERLLRFEEITVLVEAFSRIGIDRVRLTGGEPLLRHGLPTLVAQLRQNTRVREITLTTNGIRLAAQVEQLAKAGLDRVTLSLDTLSPERFRALTRRDDHASAVAGLQSLRAAGMRGTKVNMVVQRGINDDELCAMLAFSQENEFELRFIEYMDVGGATKWSADRVVSQASILEHIQKDFGAVKVIEGRASAPAQRFELADGTRFGIIPSTTEPFCGACDRSRLTADGLWFLCLYARDGINLRDPLRAGANADELTELLTSVWSKRSDRGAVDRLQLERDRSVLAEKEELGENPHLEMHTRGG